MRYLRILALTGLAALASAAATSAQELSLSLQKRHGNATIGASLNLGNGACGAQYTYGQGRRNRVNYAAPRRTWVPAGYTYQDQRVWVPASWERVWIDPVYRRELNSCGNVVRVLVRAGYWDKVRVPGRYEVQRVRVYNPGRWVVRGTYGSGCY